MKDLNEYSACLRESRDLLTPKVFYYLYDGQELDEMRTRIEMLIYEAEHNHNLTREQVTEWAMQEKEKFDADPANYYSEESACPRLNTISAATLQAKDLPPVRFIVDNILTEGLTVWASPPKYGKSWGALDLVLSVAMGARFWGYQSHKCSTLYLALEDSERRIQARMEKLLKGKPAPAGTNFVTAAYDLDNGLLSQLEDHVKNHPDTGLIVIDTLQKVRGAVHGRENPYAADYRECAALKSFADAHGLAILIIHHLRKMADDGDPFNRISGTTGISGAADAMWVLSKSKRGDDTATMYITGRDIEQQELKVRFDNDTCRWQNLGDAEAYEAQVALESYERDPVVKTIRKLLAQDPTGWEGSAQELMTAGRMLTGTTLASTNRELAEKLKSLDRWLFEVDRIDHQRKRNGSGGGKHLFTRVQGVAA